MKKQNKITNEDLARMVKKGFDGVDERFQEIKTDISDLKQGQEDIQSKLSNVAYRFEVKELEKRVEKSELELNLKR